MVQQSTDGILVPRNVHELAARSIYIRGRESFPMCSHVLALPARQEQGPLFDVFFAKSVNPILSYFKVIMTR